MRVISRAPRAKHAASAANGSAMPTTNRNAPIGGAMQLVGEQHAAREPRVRDAQVLAPDEPRQEAPAADVGERLRGPEQRTARRGRAPMFTAPVTIVDGEEREDERPGEVDDDDDPDPVDPVRDDARREPEQQHRQRSGRGAPSRRGAGRASREATSSGPAASATPSPDVGQDDRREQPPERASEARRGGRLGQARGGIGHRGSLAGPPGGPLGAGAAPSRRQRGGTVPSCRVTMPPVSAVQRHVG